jgi:hypothetical protein
MAYPTTIAFAPTSPLIGVQQIAVTSTTQKHPLGTRVRAVDPVYGEGEFIYLQGVASTAAGDIVIFDDKAGTTTRTVAASRGPVAIAMSANVASQFGWYQLAGSGVANTASAGTGAANALLQTSATAGQATVSGTASQKIDGIICKAAQDTPTSGFTVVQMDRPAANGNT